MRKFYQGFMQFMKEEDGLTTAEWVILASTIVVAAIGILSLIIPKITKMAENMGKNMDNYTPPPISGNN